jgi:hypothetical protein
MPIHVIKRAARPAAGKLRNTEILWRLTAVMECSAVLVNLELPLLGTKAFDAG